MNDREEALDFLARLGANPAVAFHEAGVAETVRAILDETGVGYSVDEFGNILACLPGSDPDVPPLAVVAHMDHPGFELVERARRRWGVRGRCAGRNTGFQFCRRSAATGGDARRTAGCGGHCRALWRRI